MKTEEVDDQKQLTGWDTWILAGRPKTLPAAAAPVIVGAALAWREGEFELYPALAALMTALLLQIGANLANDVFDYRRGADRPDRLGPVRVTATGLLTPRQVLTGMWLVFGVSALLGIYLIWVAGWPVLLIGIGAILSAIAYTGGPFPLGYYGLGDLFVFIFFGLAAVVGTYFVQARTLIPAAWWAAVPMGLLTVAILVVNNLRDIEGDRAAGKHTLAVRLGVKGARAEYLLCLSGAYLGLAMMWLSGQASPWVLLGWLSLPQGYNLVRQIYRLQGKPLNKTLAGTGQLELLFGLLFGTGLIIEGLVKF